VASICPCTKCPSSFWPKVRAGSRLTSMFSSRFPLRFFKLVFDKVSAITSKWRMFLRVLFFSIFVTVKQIPFTAIELPIFPNLKFLPVSTSIVVWFFDLFIFEIFPFALIIPVNISISFSCILAVSGFKFNLKFIKM